MLDNVFDTGSKSVIIITIISVFAILMSGIFFGVSYFVLDQLQTGLESSDCEINNNLYVSSCQELWSWVVYPVLELRELLIWISFFFIFALFAGLLIMGYQSGSNPILMGVFVIIVGVISYISIEVSNIYQTLLQNEAFRNMVIEFTVYNKIMVSLPWFMFIISLFSLILGIVNWQKAPINSSRDELNY